MSFSLATLWYERQRYLPGVLAVAFSALLIALQCGLLLGLFSVTSIPVDYTRADIWIGSPAVRSVDLGRPIPEELMSRLAGQPEVKHTEIFHQGFAYWVDNKQRSELCIIMGSRMDDGALGWVMDKDTGNGLTPEMRAKLTEPGAIIVDNKDKDRLGIKEVGDTAEINGHRVRVVDFINGYKSLAGPYIFCSLRTARPLLHLRNDQTIYLLAKCNNESDAKRVVARLREQYGNPNQEEGFVYRTIADLWGISVPRPKDGGSAQVKEEPGDKSKDMSVFTADEFSFRSRWHWLTKTGGGIALGYAALLGLLVGGVVTSQTLYAATAASLREFAVLRALGIPRRRMQIAVLAQSFWIGLAGIALALPAAFALARLADSIGAKVQLSWYVLVGDVTVTMIMAILSGLAALRSLQNVDPALPLRNV